MEFDSEVHSLKCPKCEHGMDEVTYQGIAIDRCSHCQGLWFDTGEAERLKDRWMGDALDVGSAVEGRKWNAIEDVDCPRCGLRMHKASDPGQRHIWYERCNLHGIFMDAGEFTDYKHETLLDHFRSLIRGARPAG